MTPRVCERNRASAGTLGHMDAYLHLLTPGDTATVMATGRLEDLSPVLFARPGVRLIAGDLAPTLVEALEDAIEHLGGSVQEDVEEWVDPETLDRLDRYERALDALRGGFADPEISAAHRA